MTSTPSSSAAISIEELPQSPASSRFGTSYLAELGLGVDLEPAGYVEQEFFLTGRAGQWSYDSDWAPTLLDSHPYTTRALVRRPADPARFTGLVLLEPLHPDLDGAPTWRSASDWVLRSGHAWVGVTQSAAVAADLAWKFPRYASLAIPPVGLGFGLDILGQAASALRSGGFGIADVDRIVLSGWSITGSFCRVFLQEGFVARHGSGTRPAVDGILIGKSSGAFDRAGYPPLTTDAPVLPRGHARRTVRGAVPTMEVLSETEGETHGPALRADSDEPGDRYRLYQVAATTHRQLGSETRTPNAAQYAAAGGELGDTRINETPSDARIEVFTGALLDHLDRWIRGASTPPRAPRFAYVVDDTGAPSALQRDADGTVVGGIRPPWLTVPTALYRPTSTPAPGACRPLDRFPATGTPEQAASMIGHRVAFSQEELDQRYGSEEDYRHRLAAAVLSLVDDGFVLREDGERYLAEAAFPGAS